MSGPDGAMGREATPPAVYQQNSNAIDDYSEFAERPDFGRAGSPIKVLANMFQAVMPARRLIYHYDVDMVPVVKTVPDKLAKKFGWEIWKQVEAAAPAHLVQSIEQAVFDGVKNMYTPVPLSTDNVEKVEITVSLHTGNEDPEHDRRRFKVSLQLANKLDLGSINDYCQRRLGDVNDQTQAMSAIQAVQILLRHEVQSRPQPFDVSRNGKKFIGLDGSQSIPNGGVVNYGFMASMRPTENGTPALQLDTAYAACLRAGPLIHIIEDMLQSSTPERGFGDGRGGRAGIPDSQRSFPRTTGPSSIHRLDSSAMKKIKPILLRSKFKVTHRPCPEPFSITGFTPEPAERVSFDLDAPNGNQRHINIVDYFWKTYNVRVTKPGLPCVIYGKGNMVPMEFVDLQHFNRITVEKLSPDQAASMIKVTAKPPGQRRALVDDWRRRLDFNALPRIRAWGISISSAMTAIDARVLPAPVIKYKDGRTINAQRGTWNIRGVQFRGHGASLKSWSVVSFDPRTRERELARFLDKFIRVLNMQGIHVENNDPPLLVEDPNVGGPMTGINGALARAARAAYQHPRAEQRDPQMILVVVPKKDLVFYGEVKRIAMTALHKPVVTQVLQSSKINNDRGIDPYLGNLSMKIQAKLGGVTHGVDIPLLDASTIMIGADVSHPTGRGSSAIQPSIAVSVASIDGQHDAFEHCIRLQTGRTEMIQDFGSMVKNHLERFKHFEKDWPKRIIVFRDGVSEGQYGQVKESELGRLRQAARELMGFEPKVTLVICAKRHHMRFYSTNPRDEDRTGNLPAGLVIDRGVTHPFAFDFYLQAHAGLQGTAKPTHYVVVEDDNRLQGLAHSLCYTYARSCRAVSLVPVAYYADIIAGKCRDFVYDDDASSITPSVNSRGTLPSDFDPFKLKKLIDDSAIQRVAWYM